MADEYASLDELKQQIGITGGADDTLLAIVNESVSRTIDGYCGRRFYADGSAVARVFRADDLCVLDVQDFYDDASLIIATDDNADGIFETAWVASDYQLEPLNAEALGRPWRHLVAVDVRRWPVGGPRARVEVTAKWGWAEVPPQVKEATLIQAARVFARAQSPLGVAGNAEFGAIRMLASRLDPDVQVLLDEGGLRLGGDRTGPQTVRVR